jgi:hypothetical protein
MRLLQTAACAVILSAAAYGQQTAAPSAPKAASPAQQPTQPAQPQAPVIPPPAHPITADQIKEMQVLTGAADIKKRIVANAMQYYRRMFPPYIPQDVIDDLGKSLESADLESPAAQIYPKYISTEDAAKIIDFYKSSAGQNLLKAQPYMMTEMQRSAAEVAQQTAREVMERHKAEIEAAGQKYMQQQQQSKPSLNAPAPKPSTPQSTPQK